MRKVLVSLSVAGLLVSLFAPSCVIKEDKGDGGDGGDSSSSQGGSVFAGGSSAKGGTPSAGGNVGATKPAEPCTGLLEQLRTSAEQVCSQSKQEAKFSHINMLIVVDKSGSMNSTPAGYTKSKWAGAVDALKKSLNPNDTLISYGITLFPQVGATTCEYSTGADAINVKIGSADQTVPQINDLMLNTTPSGGTPTAAALGAALGYYTAGEGIGLEGDKYVLLVTDGGPNCNSDNACAQDKCTAFLDKSPSLASCWNGGVANCCDPINQSAKDPIPPQALCLDDASVTNQLNALRAQGIKTFVIGIPGSEAYAAYLDGFAESGGVPVEGKARKYYEVTGESGLADAFKTITTSLVSSCDVPLDQAPQDKNAINVAIDCSPLPQTSGEVANWAYDEATQSIQILGAKCDQIKASGVNRIDVVNGCPVYKIQ
jgi:hypothetical protein